MKIAFLCLAHNNFKYIEELSKYCCSDNDGFFLHIDKSALRPHNLLLHKNSIEIEDRYRTRWGTFEIVEATLSLLETALSKEKYDYFILISGTDLPLLEKYKLKNKLIGDGYFSIWDEAKRKQDNKSEFFKMHFYHSSLTNPGEAYASKNRARILITLILNKIISFFPSPVKYTFGKYIKGSQWWCVSLRLAKEIIRQSKDDKIKKQFRYMHAPDEKFFHTIAYNSNLFQNLKTTYNQDNVVQGLHYIDWFAHLSSNTESKYFTLEMLNFAIENNCAFSRKIPTGKVVCYIEHLKKITT